MLPVKPKLVFMEENKPVIRAEKPDIDLMEMAKEIEKRWKKLSKEDK